MKKKFITPNLRIVKFELRGILAGSDPSNLYENFDPNNVDPSQKDPSGNIFGL